MKNRRFLHDALLALGVLMLAGVLYLCLHRAAGPGAWAIIEQDGVELTRLPLEEEAHYSVESLWGHNLVCTGDGGVWMEEADCPDQICVHEGVIMTRERRIVCLPHRLVVRIEGGSGAMDDVVR